MGRTANKGVDPVELQPLDGETLLATQNLMASQSAEVMALYGDGLAYDRERVIGEARFYMGAAAEAMLEAGKRLIQLKENEGHGEFLEIITNRLGLGERAARLMMQAAAKFLQGSPQLTIAAPKLMALGKTKLYDLMLEDDEQLAALAEGGTLAGLSLDDVDRMTSRELRAALREARESYSAQGEVMARKNRELDETRQALEKTRRQVQAMSRDELACALRQETAAAAYEVEATLQGSLRAAFAKLEERARDGGEDHRTFKAALVRQLEITLAAIRGEFHLPQLRDADALPAWQTLLGVDDLAEA